MRYCKKCEGVIDHDKPRLKCTECIKKYDRDRKKDNPIAKVTAARINKEWVKRNPEKQRERSRRWKANNRDKHAVHVKVKDAIRYGRIARPDSCSKCGSFCKPEAHHNDYSKPLDVTWLCRPCHVELHKQERIAA